MTLSSFQLAQTYSASYSHASFLLRSCLGILYSPSIHFAFAIRLACSSTRIEMRNPFRFRPRPVAQSVKTVPKRKDVTTILPPPYEEYPQSEGAVSLPSSVRISCPVLALKRCLIWRMAIDWGLQHHISKSERPSNREYSTFEGNCGVFGALLGKRCLDPQETEKHLWTYIFEPADRMGLEKSKQYRHQLGINKCL